MNDISAGELALASEWASKACFDICSPPTDVHAKFDLIFSKMVFEHISDAKKHTWQSTGYWRQADCFFHFFRRYIAFHFL